MNPTRGESKPLRDQTNIGGDSSGAPEAWEAPRLISLDLGAAQAKFCRFSDETAPDNGPKMVSCSS